MADMEVDTRMAITHMPTSLLYTTTMDTTTTDTTTTEATPTTTLAQWSSQDLMGPTTKAMDSNVPMAVLSLEGVELRKNVHPHSVCLGGYSYLSSSFASLVQQASFVVPFAELLAEISLKSI